MSRRIWIATGGGAAVAAAVIALWFSSSIHGPNDAASVGFDSADPAFHDGALAARPIGAESGVTEDRTAKGEVDADARTPERVPAEQPRLSIVGRVLDEQGQGIEGAPVTWTPLRLEFDAPTWCGIDWSAVEAATTSAISGRDGAFTLGVASESFVAMPSVLWATHPGRRAASAWLDVTTADALRPHDIVMTASSGCRVRVVDGGGAPVVGAEVHQYGLATMSHPDATDPARSRTQRVFHRVSATDSTGVATLGGHAFDCAILARHSDSESAAYTGTEIAELELVIRPCFELQGTVTARDGAPLEPATLVGTAARYPGYLDDWLAFVSVRAEGSFGPYRLPIEPASTYAFKLWGSGLLTQVIERPTPQAGDLVNVDFRATRGVDVDVRVVGADREPIEGAWVRIQWGELIGIETRDHDTKPTLTNAQGIALVRGSANGIVSVRAGKKGYAPTTAGPFNLPPPDGEQIEVTLTKAGAIEGRVVHQGTAVPNFDIVWWRDDPLKFKNQQFRGAADGRFRIEPVPVGPIKLIASSPQYPRGDTVSAIVAEDSIPDVVLELPAVLIGRGRVVDGETQQPVSGASVQVYTNAGPQMLTPWGDAVASDHDGRFEVRGCAPGDTRVIVSAAGYRMHLLAGTGVPGRDIEFGLVPLERARTVRFELRSTAPVDFTHYALSLSGSQFLDAVPFPADGVFLVQDCGEGRYDFTLHHPDGSTTFTFRYFRAGGDWSVVHDLAPGVRLVVALEAAAGEQVPANGEARATWRSLEGGPIMRSVDWSDATVVFDGVRDGSVDVTVFDDQGELLGQARYRGVVAPETRVSLSLSTEERRFQVMSSGAPAPAGTRVWLRCADDETGWTTIGTTGDDGVVSLPEPPCSELVSTLYHPAVGVHFGGSIVLGPDPDELVVLEFDPSGTLRARLLDGEDPLGGLSCWAFEPKSGAELTVQATNAAGVATWEHVAPCAYTLLIGGQAVWDTSATIVATTDPTEAQAVQVRRLGGLELSLTTPQGVPVTGAAVSLHSIEFSADVSDWISAGKLAAPPQGLATDGSGKLRIDGLPRGEYAWSVVSSTGESIEGTVVVPPHGVGKAAAFLP